jgi:S-DNA-T family DNA segregation ATPase FtsK/SpoIIIE
MASYQMRRRDPLLDQGMQAMIERRGREVLGLTLIGLAALFALMLYTYSPDDPSWMSATSDAPHNMLGRSGASITAILIPIIGLGAWGIPAVLLAWGLRFATHRGADRALSRVVFAAIAVALGSVYAATLVPGVDWTAKFGLGGAFGDTVLGALIELVPGGGAFALKLVSLLVAVAFIAMFLFVTGFDVAEVLLIVRFLIGGLILSYAGVMSLLGLAAKGTVAGATTMQDRLRETRAQKAEARRLDEEDRAEAEARAAEFARIARPDRLNAPAPLLATAAARATAQRAAAPRPVETAEAPRAGILGRMPSILRRPAVEPEEEEDVVDPGQDDRIRARISSAIRSRTSDPGVATSPITAAIQRREPPVTGRANRPQPLIVRPAAAPVLPPEPPVTTARRAAIITAPVVEEDLDDADDDWPEIEEPVVLRAAERPATDARRPVVQPSAPKQAAPSRRALAEAQPSLRFDDPPSHAYELPPLSLLSQAIPGETRALSQESLEENARMLETVLDDYGVRGEITSVRPGPVVTMYELEPAPGLKASRVIGLADDIARSMSALSARVSTVPGRTVIGIELPNAWREKVVLREILASRAFGDGTQRLPLALGKDIGGEPIVANLAKMPHLLIAGTTGSGKSVAINTMILSLLYKLTPEECRLIMIDPKMLELSVYDGIPHLLSPVVTDPKKAVVALKWVVSEMEDRYRKMSKMGVRNIEGYNGRVREALSKGEMFKRTIQTGFDDDTGEPVFETDEFAPVTIPYIVVVVDEMADLMMVAGKEIEACIQRLAQMARASGIHLIMATQRPSVDVITGTIKANFPTRISFQVTSKIDSRTILGEQGAEQLLGMGDMLYMAGGGRISRIHGPFVSDEEVEEIVAHLKSFGPPEYMSGVTQGPEDEAAAEIDSILGIGADGLDDTLYDQAVAIVAKDRKCSTSYIQRKLGIGYNKAAKLVEQMEEHGVVTRANHVGKREILVEER